MADIIKYDMTDIWATAGDVVAPDSAKIKAGWGVEVVPRQWWNWFENRQDQNIAYMLQKGFPEWDATTEYIINKSYVQRNGIVYKATATTTGVDPTGLVSWIRVFADYSVASNAFGSMSPTTDNIPYFTSTTTAGQFPSTVYGRGVSNLADIGAALTYFGAQAANVNLTALSSVTGVANGLPYFNGGSTMTTTTLTAFGRSLIDDSDATTARATIGLDQVTNTSDANKPVSTAQQAALNLKANAAVQVQAGAGLAGGGALTGNVAVSIANNMIPATAQQMNQSLDTYQTPGFYYQPQNASALLSNNYPIQLAGALVVTTSAGVVQEYTTYGVNCRKFIRGFYSTWSPWVEVFTSLNQLALGTTAVNARSVLGLSYPATADITGSGLVALGTSPAFSGVPTAPTAANGTSSTQIATTAFVINNATSNPPGTILAYAGTTVPTGYLLANGALLNRVNWAPLFAAIGTTYGSTDSTNFAIPDLRGEFLRGLDNGRGVDSGRGLGTFQVSQLGSHDHIFTGSALPVHTHTSTTDTTGDHVHTMYMSGTNTSYGFQGTGSGTGAYKPTTSAGAHSHVVTVSSNSAGTPSGTISASGGTTNSSETRGRNVAVQFLIKY
jgi:microcystin-dependent protein